MVCAELDLVPFFRERVRTRHDPCIVDEDVEPRFTRAKCIGCCGDAGEGGQVEREVDDFAGGGDGGFDGLDGGGGFGGRASGEVDAGGVVRGEVEDCLFA